MRRSFYTAFEDEIKEGKVTDIYFVRSREVLKKVGAADRRVYAEVHAYDFPRGYSWAVFAGVEEVARMLEGKPINVYAMEEGELFRVYEPVMGLEGRYVDFGVFESSLLGILRHATSVATKAARVKLAAGDKALLFFGIRSVHPAIAPMVDRYAFIGGCDAVSGVLGAELLGVKPVGTMPHALILALGGQAEAWRAFDKAMPEEVPRIALCDTLSDERFEALMAAETLRERLHGVRFDTPSSRRGDMRKIVREARWALDLAGYKHVKIYVSGGLDEEEVERLRDLADGFGVGTSIAFPPSIDLAMDIVEVEGKPFSKRGKLPGRKQVYRCPKIHDTITPYGLKLQKCLVCGERVKPLIKPLIVDGKIVREFKSAEELRKKVQDTIKNLPPHEEFEPEPILHIPQDILERVW